VDIAVFEYVCLRKLGRDDDAAGKLRQFRESFPPKLPNLGLGDVAVDGQTLDERAGELLAPDGLAASLLRDLYAAEVFLSVNAVDVGEDHFRQRIAAGDDETQRLSAAIVLAQLLLLQDKRNEYVELALDEIVRPVLAGRLPREWTLDWPWFNTHGVLLLTGGMTLLPMVSEEFLEGVDETRVARLAEACEAQRPDDPNDEAWWLDFALAVAYGRLQRAEEQAKALARLEAHPGTWPSASGDAMKQKLTELRTMIRQLSKFEGWPSR
jgi:hypothetical protein